jgi:putative acetyltransferase
MIRIASVNDVDEIRQLFYDTITTVNLKDYGVQQTTAWAKGYQYTDRWKNKISTQYFIVDEREGIIAGFASLAVDGYIDMMYVHKNNQGKGIAKQLLHALETKAIAAGITELTTDASITARPFFEHFGYFVLQQQSVVRDGIELTNFKMIKNLNII